MTTRNIISILATFCLIQTSQAVTTSFYWQSGASEARNNSGANLPSGRAFLTFVSPDATINWSSIWDDATDGGNYGAGGNDIYLNTLPTTGVGGGRYNTATTTDITGTYNGYYVYGVLLDLANGSPVTAGTYYDITSVAYGPLADRLNPGFPDLPAQSFTDGILQTSSTISIVPEPSTMALVACGMGVLVARRRRQQSKSS